MTEEGAFELEYEDPQDMGEWGGRRGPGERAELGSSSSPGVPKSRDLASITTMTPMWLVALGSLCSLFKLPVPHPQNADHFISSSLPSSHLPLLSGCSERKCSFKLYPETRNWALGLVAC